MEATRKAILSETSVNNLPDMQMNTVSLFIPNISMMGFPGLRSSAMDLNE